MDKRRRFLINTAVLAGSDVLLRLCGIWFRSVVAVRIGAGGIGLYQLIFSVFYLGVTACTSGFGLAMTRLAAEGKASLQCVRRCLALALALSVLAMGALFFGADFFAGRFIRNMLAARPLRILACGLPLIACCACLKGWFFARRNTAVPVLAEFVEESAAVALSLVLLDLSPLPPLESLTLGSTAGEAAAVLYLVPAFLRHARRHGFSKTGGTTRQIVHIAGPMLAGSFLRSGLSGAENLLIPVCLQKNGADGLAAISQYGVVQGMVMPVLCFPMSLISSAAMLLIPDIAEATAKRDDRAVRRTADAAFRFAQMFGLPAAVFFFLFSDWIGGKLFGSAQAAQILRIMAPLGPLMYLDNVADNLLKGLDQQMYSLKVNLLDSLLRVGLIVLLLPRCGIRAYLVILFASEIFNGLLSVGKLLQVTKLRANLKGWALKPAAAAALVFLALEGLKLLAGRFSA